MLWCELCVHQSHPPARAVACAVRDHRSLTRAHQLASSVLRGLARQRQSATTASVRASAEAGLKATAPDVIAALSTCTTASSSAVRLAAGVNLIKVARSAQLDRLVRPVQWHSVALLVQVGSCWPRANHLFAHAPQDGEIGAKFTELVMKELHLMRLPVRYLALPMLCATAAKCVDCAVPTRCSHHALARTTQGRAR